MLKRPTYSGVDAILKAFENINKNGDLIYSVWHSREDILFQCTLRGDPEGQKEMLKDNLTDLEEQGNNDLLHLKFHPGDTEGYITRKTPVIAVLPVTVNDWNNGAPSEALGAVYRPGSMPPGAYRQLQELTDKIGEKIDAAIDAKLKELLPEVEAEPEPEPIEKYMGMIKGITENPQLMGLIGRIFNLLQPVAPPVMPRSIGMVEPGTQQQEIQPIPFNEDDMNAALNVLRYHCDLGVCLQKLASVAQNNPAYFQTLLQILMKS